jgi:hypothetical protein
MNTATESTVLSDRLRKMKDTYGSKVVQEAVQSDILRRFDSESTYKDSKGGLKRISKQPSVEAITEMGQLHADMAGLELDLAELAESYGKLNISFSDLISKEGYGPLNALIIGFYDVINKDKARKLKIDFRTKRGDSIAYLVNKMAEVLVEQHQKAKETKIKAENLQVENISHMRSLDQKIIDELRSGYVGDADYAAAKDEVDKLENELGDIDSLLMNYESKVQEAKAERDLKTVDNLTSEMSDLLEIKYGVVDGKLSAEGVVSDIRRKMLDSAEGVQSAKGALSASRVNYRTISLLTDAMAELEIKYRHAKEDMIPVFKIQGNVAAMGKDALRMNEALLKTADISHRLMEMNVRLVTHLGYKVHELTTTSLYDPARAREVEAEITGTYNQLVEMKEEFIANQQTVKDIGKDPQTYVQQK